MATIKVNPGNIESAVSRILEEYFDNIYDNSDEAVALTAAETVADLMATSPKNTGKYAKGWKVKQTKKQKTSNEVEVYNTRHQLTHLLEHGHIKVVHGKVLGFTAARPHIANAERKAISRLKKRIKEVAKG